ncbi:Phosphoglycolate phosphatase, HAD superfamily [Actinacidiphila guanduensis]|uniref:Phosphoglycolate phosphatase, HAD superfamily n=1 Tax=Actinacidiphila guanduensis TaxID=310781 RepID=A0A1G9Y9R9_9ACTN|nr:Phosphoglycolate phosphatase, HAD superfamily [Actinacidiphila guanduensis]
MRTQARIDGITEAVIFRETARLHGIGTTRRDFERFAAALAAAHVEHAAGLRERGHALPGAALVLDRLAAVPGVVQTVVTGNVRAVAEIKLAAFDLDRPIQWDLGAYGEDADERANLVLLALHRAGDVDPTEAVLLGDTPAGRDAGVPVIGVATGGSSAEELHEAGAARVLPDLTDADRVME